MPAGHIIETGTGLTGRSGARFWLRLTNQPRARCARLVFLTPCEMPEPARTQHLSRCLSGGNSSSPNETVPDRRGPRGVAPVLCGPLRRLSCWPWPALRSALGGRWLRRGVPSGAGRTWRPGYVPVWRSPGLLPRGHAAAWRCPARPGPFAPGFRQPGLRWRRWRHPRRRGAVVAPPRQIAAASWATAEKNLPEASEGKRRA